MPSRCRSCKAEITWAVTPKGRRMPLDVEDVRLVAIEPQARASAIRGLFALVDGVAHAASTVDAPGARILYRSHFATCPDADQHRKKASDG